MKKGFGVLAISVVLLGSYWNSARATALYSTSQSVDVRSNFVPTVSYSKNNSNDFLPINWSYSFDGLLWGPLSYPCGASTCTTETYATGTLTAYSSADLGLLRTQAALVAAERWSGPLDYSVESAISAIASFNDVLWTVSEKKPDGTPYLPDGTVINAFLTPYLQSFQTGCSAARFATAGNILDIRVGGDYGPWGRIGHVDCDFTSGSAILIPIQLVIGAALPFTETLTSYIYDTTSHQYPLSSISADASDTAGLAITFDSPYVKYTTASGATYPTSPFAEEAAIPEPGSVVVLLSALAIGGIARRRRLVISPQATNSAGGVRAKAWTVGLRRP